MLEMLSTKWKQEKSGWYNRKVAEKLNGEETFSTERK